MELADQILKSVKSGGVVMIILAALSYLLYWQIISLLLYVNKIKLFTKLDASRHDKKFINLSEDPQTSQDEIALAKYESVHWQFSEFVKNRLTFASVLLTAAPLLGLLGTVLGMLEMFEGLSMQAGNQTTMLVAEGVKQSLITTQTGLTIAIPAIFFVYWIRRTSKKRELELLEHKILHSEKSNGHADA